MAGTADHGTLALPALTPAPRLLIVCAPYYRAIADDLIAGAQAVLAEAGAGADLVEVPGALEVPVAIRLAAEARAYEGYVALGCVIRGETTHYETVCNDSSRGLMLLGVERGLAIGNGILTCETIAQAEIRAARPPAVAEGQDKGGGAAAAALHLIALARRFRSGGGGSGASGPGPDAPGADILLAAAATQPRTA